MSKSPAEELAPCAWRRISNISGECTGLFAHDDVELRTERLEPLYSAADVAAQVAYAAGASAAFAACVKACEDLNTFDEDDPGASCVEAIRKLASKTA